MDAKTKYFVIPSTLLIKFEGNQYWFWGDRSKQWIQNRALINSRLMQITDSDAQKILATNGAPTSLELLTCESQT